MNTWKIHHAAVEVWGKEYTGPKFHAAFCDPPYGLKFMGKDWDVLAAEEWGRAIIPHLHPGALMLMFGGTRTWHKLACGIEAAGFQMFDTLMWVYGSGFPKAQDLSVLIDKQNGDARQILGVNPLAGKQTGAKNTVAFGDKKGIEHITGPGSPASAQWSGWKTPALKPAWEPVLCFAVPRGKETFADIAQRYGAGSLNIEACRIAVERAEDPDASPLGRFPANLILDEHTGALIDAQSGVSDSNDGWHKRGESREVYGEYGESWHLGFGDRGGASRFFYCAKASDAERNAGLVNRKNNHPTVKPLDLTQWLARLLLPPEHVAPRRLLVPFSGSGSEVIGAIRAGWDEVIGVERDAHFFDLSERRIAGQAPGLFAVAGGAQ